MAHEAWLQRKKEREEKIAKGERSDLRRRIRLLKRKSGY
jgi:hypothetical protein